MGDGMAAEIISALSRLRWLRVIARESSFRFRQDRVDFDQLRQVLGATYALSGRVEQWNRRLSVTVDLIDARTGVIVWSDHFAPALDDIHNARLRIVLEVIAAIGLQIPQLEAQMARLKPSEHLDAWGAFHLGVSHFYRFNAHDNAIACGLFQRATELDPNFAVAFAARSYARFQDVMIGYKTDTAAAVTEARGYAERAVELDPNDPFANMAVGRIHMIEGDPQDGVIWYERSVHLSPSFFNGHFSLGIADILAGRTQNARLEFDQASGLSPLDPLLAPLLATKALAYMAEGDMVRALESGVRAARTNPAHFHAVTTAIIMCQLSGDLVQADHWARHLRARRPDASADIFLRGLRYADPRTQAKIRGALAAMGIP